MPPVGAVHRLCPSQQFTKDRGGREPLARARLPGARPTRNSIQALRTLGTFRIRACWINATAANATIKAAYQTYRTANA